MWRLLFLTSLFALLLGGSLLLPSPVQAAGSQPGSAPLDGIIIPEPPCRDCLPPPCPEPGMCPIPSPMVQLVIRYHHVEVTITDQVAITRVDQVFYNPNNWTVEGTYLFPLPAGAAVTGFTLWVDGKPVQGQVLEAEQARQTYEQIVSSLRDPALLEYAGYDLVQARIFPIEPGGEGRVQLEYTQAVTSEEGLVRYVYPLSTEKFSAWPLEQVIITVDIQSNLPIRLVYSPSHPVDVQRTSDQHVTASYEASDVLPDADFALYYSTGETEAFHLLSYRNPGDDPDGFFLLLLAPRPTTPERILPKDVILVLDRSGSMEGEKFTQAQAAARYVLEHLNPEDSFNLIAFSTGMEAYAPGLRPATEAGEAAAWLDRQSSAGSTDIYRALLEAAALAHPERPTYIIFLTDGLPTEGIIDSGQILKDFAANSGSNLRLFTFGVGYDVDTFLLDSLAQNHHGASFYVQPGERLDEALLTFYARISTPVLTDLSLDFGDMTVYDLYPTPLPDLFSGSQIILAGRYRQGGAAAVHLSGALGNERQTFEFPVQFFATNSEVGDPQAGTLPRLWATRKIGFLLNQIRLQGADTETIDQIVRLSIRYGIVTPYTSYLVTEDQPLGEEARQQIVEKEANAMQEAAPSFGQQAVQKAAGQGALAGADSAASAPAETAGRIRVLGARTFILNGSTWIDTGFDPGQMKTIKVAFLSDDYFALVQAQPELATAFSLGQSVIALSGGKVYEVVAEDHSDEVAGDHGDKVTNEPINPEDNNKPTAVSQTTPEEQTPLIPTDADVEPGAVNPPGARSNAISCLGIPLALVGIAGLTWRKRSRQAKIIIKRL